MATQPAKTRNIIAIVGPTSSGKSSVAMKIAADWPVEIICADSRTIITGADIGTAKPSSQDQANVVHWGLDIINPRERFSVFDFKNYAEAAIKDILQRKKIPLLVGGSGLYIDSLVYDYELRPGYDPNLRQHLETKTIKQLQDNLLSLGHELPRDPLNKRRLIRAIEADGRLPSKKPPSDEFSVFGIWPGDKYIKDSIISRVNSMVDFGFEKEVADLISVYGSSVVGELGIGYKSFVNYLEGQLTLDEAKELFVRGDWQYSKRQRTWFKRNKNIDWSDDSSECYNKVIQFLNKNCSN